MREDLKSLREPLDRLRDFIESYIVGMKDLIRLLMIALLTEGHVLIEGPPGTGKTLAAKLLASSIGGVFRRIQMVPDILPSDVLGSFYYDLQKSQWIFREGPVFANILFVDELSRAPPRTQSALLEAMQEGRVSIEGRFFDLPKPFLVIATQIYTGSSHVEGVYPLTHTLLDRFAYSYRTSYADPQDEIKILDKIDDIDEIIRSGSLKPLIETKDILKLQKIVREIYVDQRIKRYIIDIISSLRKSEDLAVKPSTRASIWLLKGSRALALLEGEEFVVPDHVKKIAPYVLSHRIEFKSEFGEERDVYKYIQDLLSRIEVPKL